MRIDILSLFPGYFKGPFDESIIKRARLEGILDIRMIDIRQFAEGKHQRVDERPYGGGPGMVMMPGPTCEAIRSVRTSKAHVVYLSPQGAILDASKCRQLANKEHIVLLCGHYEGVDERALAKEVDEEISIGDYVLTNGCLAAIVLVDAVSRFLPGVIGHAEAAGQDSFEKGIFDCPHFTRPETFEGVSVPELLLSGNHERISRWRNAQALAKTRATRIELFAEYLQMLRETEEFIGIERKRRKPEVIIHLLVKDLNKSLAFYRKILGFKVNTKGLESAELRFPGSNESVTIHLIEGLNDESSISNQALYELVYQDEEAFQGTRNRLEIERKAKYSKPHLLCCQDPDGYEWCLAYAGANYEL